MVLFCFPFRLIYFFLAILFPFLDCGEYDNFLKEARVPHQERFLKAAVSTSSFDVIIPRSDADWFGPLFFSKRPQRSFEFLEAPAPAPIDFLSPL